MTNLLINLYHFRHSLLTYLFNLQITGFIFCLELLCLISTRRIIGRFKILSIVMLKYLGLQDITLKVYKWFYTCFYLLKTIKILLWEPIGILSIQICYTFLQSKIRKPHYLKNRLIIIVFVVNSCFLLLPSKSMNTYFRLTSYEIFT